MAIFNSFFLVTKDAKTSPQHQLHKRLPFPLRICTDILNAIFEAVCTYVQILHVWFRFDDNNLTEQQTIFNRISHQPAQKRKVRLFYSYCDNCWILSLPRFTRTVFGEFEYGITFLCKSNVYGCVFFAHYKKGLIKM